MVTIGITVTLATSTDPLGPCSPALRKYPNYKLRTHPGAACFSLFVGSIEILCELFRFKFLKHFALYLTFKVFEEG